MSTRKTWGARPRIDDERAYQLKKEGLSYAIISTRLGFCHTVVKQAVERWEKKLIRDANEARLKDNTNGI